MKKVFINIVTSDTFITVVVVFTLMAIIFMEG